MPHRLPALLAATTLAATGCVAGGGSLGTSHHTAGPSVREEALQLGLGGIGWDAFDHRPTGGGSLGVDVGFGQARGDGPGWHRIDGLAEVWLLPSRWRLGGYRGGWSAGLSLGWLGIADHSAQLTADLHGGLLLGRFGEHTSTFAVLEAIGGIAGTPAPDNLPADHAPVLATGATLGLRLRVVFSYVSGYGWPGNG